MLIITGDHDVAQLRASSNHRPPVEAAAITRGEPKQPRVSRQFVGSRVPRCSGVLSDEGVRVGCLRKNLRGARTNAKCKVIAVVVVAVVVLVVSVVVRAIIVAFTSETFASSATQSSQQYSFQHYTSASILYLGRSG